jgi:hypothetical protein
MKIGLVRLKREDLPVNPARATNSAFWRENFFCIFFSLNNGAKVGGKELVLILCGKTKSFLFNGFSKRL